MEMQPLAKSGRFLMDALDGIRSIRSIRHFDPGRMMTENEIRTLIPDAMSVPTSFNPQH